MDCPLKAKGTIEAAVYGYMGVGASKIFKEKDAEILLGYASEVREICHILVGALLIGHIKIEIELPKIVIISTAPEDSEVDKVQKGIKQRGEGFFIKRNGSRLVACKDVPKLWFDRILENLEIVHLNSDVLTNVLYHSQVFKEPEFQLKKNIDLYACPIGLEKETAIKLLKESPLCYFLFEGQEQTKTIPASRSQLLNKFNKLKSNKGKTGVKAFHKILRRADFSSIEEETKRILRTDVSIMIDSQEFAFEFAFHTKGLKQYVANKITTYWREIEKMIQEKKALHK